MAVSTSLATETLDSTPPPEPTAADVLRSHRRVVIRRIAIIGVLTVGALGAFIWSAAVGALDLSLTEVLRGMLSPNSVDEQTRTVLWKLRLPMSVMALLVGVALSLAGAQMQTILGNPLAEPFTLGISAAAAFGGAVTIVLGTTIFPVSQFNLAAMAWLFAMLATAIIVGAALLRGATSETMILLGIGLVFFFQAMLALVQYIATTEALQQIVFWSMGSMTRATWTGNLVIALSLAVCIPVFIGLAWRLTALRLGDDRALAMGINVSRLRIVVLVLVSMLAATAVAFAGIIGFIGLVGPHVARMLVGEDQKFFIPASMAAGALTMCTAHALSMIIVPGVAIPIGIITAFVGVPFFLVIVMTNRRALW